MRIGTRGRSIGSAALGLVLVGAALFVSSAAASAQDGQPTSESDSRLLLYAGVALLAIATVLVGVLRHHQRVRRSGNGTRSRAPKPNALVPASATLPTAPTSNGTAFVPGELDLSVSDFSLPEQKPQSASVGSGAETEPLSVALESESASEPSGVSTMWLERSSDFADAGRNSTFDDKMQEFLRELRSYHK